MRGVAAAIVLLAAAALVVWTARLGVATYRDAKASDDGGRAVFDREIDRWNRVTFAAVLWGIPVLVLAVLGAPRWLSTAYVFVSAAVLAAIVIRRRARP